MAALLASLMAAAGSSAVASAPMGAATVIRDIAYPTDIAAGADGNLWFTNDSNDSIGRITPAGVVSNFRAPGIESPRGIAAGPDGNLWFANHWNDSIGRITPTGVISTFTGAGIDQPTDITAGPDGNLWFTNSYPASIGRITPAGVVSTFAGPGISSPTGITAGPDGNLWFTDDGYPASIGRITPGGLVSSFTSPAIQEPSGIVGGPDGNVWFTDGGKQSIGRITPDGVISSFAVPDYYRTVHSPNGITAGPDGNLWFTKAPNQSIGRITPAGVVSDFTGLGIDDPAGMVAGPDGNQWFTNRGNDSIGRVTPAGVVSNFTDLSIKGPTGIAAGPDGNLWFTNGWNSSIGRITPSGVVSTFTSPSIGGPTGIVAGPDGNLWFTDGWNRSIGRITPSGVVSTFTDPRLVSPSAIAAGSDGNLWFIDDDRYNDDDPGAIGRITPAGGVSIFTDPRIDAPQGIAAGPDGNLWFTNRSSHDDPDSIGRMTPAGAVTTFTGWPTVQSPDAIAAGPDGALWFGNFTGRFIGRITTEGELSQLDTDRIYPDVIAAGPGGRMWFAGSNSVGWVGTDVAVPSAPVGVSAVAGDGRATVSWAAPTSDGGAVVTGYRVTAAPGGQSCAWSGGPLSCTVNGLANGTASTFTVVATNTRGPGPASAPSSAVVPAGVPGAPVGVTAQAGDGRATVSWSAPASDGGSVVTGYRVTASSGGQGCVWSGGPLSCTVTGLVNGTSSTFTVVATNERGAGPASASSNAVTPTDGLAFHPLTPARVLDSRPGVAQIGPYGTPWGPGQTREVTVTAVGGVPAGAGAVVMNVAVTGTTAAGYLTIWPAGQPQPLASSLNWVRGQTIANAVTVKVGAGGAVSVFNEAENADVIVDVVGYYDANPGDGFTSLTPARILDSRLAGPAGTAWGPGQTRDVAVTGIGGVPPGADAVVVNVTVTRTSAAGFLTIWPAGQSRPLASSLNWTAAQTIPNAVTVKIGAGGRVSVFNQAGEADVIFDVVGFFASGTGQLFHPLSPTRIQDSRPGAPRVGPYSTPWASGAVRDVQVSGAGGVPSGAAAALLNVTVTGTTAAGYLTIWPAGQVAPLASSLNWRPGETIPNAVTTKLGAGGAISVGNASGNVHVIADTTGWYG